MKYENIERLVKKKEINNSQDNFLIKLEEKIEEIKDTYIYIKCLAKYYWVENKIFFSPHDVCHNLLLSQKELSAMRQYWLIETYDNLVYKKWWLDNCYNLLNEEQILQPSKVPELHPTLEYLFENVCGYKKENIDYLHRTILYKYINLNDFTIPAIVLYGHWWSGKWTLMSLLSNIFHSDNTLANLWQKDLTGSFDTYRGQKLIVEFAEIATNNTHSDIWVLNKLKNIIGAEKINVNEKWVRQYQIDNIAWFFISSNSNKPLQLDDKDKGNRRFTIIKSHSKLENGKEINDIINNRKIIQNYISWLFKSYPEVLSYVSIEALDNEDKRDLEERGQSEANQFWEWLEDNFPDYYGKKSKVEIEEMINIFCIDNWINEIDFNKYFWSNSRYPKKKIRLWDKTLYGVIIHQKKS